MINPLINLSSFPLAYFVLRMNEVWEVPDEDEEVVATTFLSLWPNVKTHLKSLPKGSLDDIMVEMPNASQSDQDMLDSSFYNQLWSMDMYLMNTKRFEEAYAFCQDMLDLFSWDVEDESHWIGVAGDCLWRLDPARGEVYFKEHLSGYNETIMGYYSFNLLSEKRWDEAKEALKGYKKSKDDIIQDRLRWLKQRK